MQLTSHDHISLTILRLLLFATGGLAAFTQLTCTSKNECVVPQGGGFCYDPKQSDRVRHVSCTEEHFDLSQVMIKHINSKTSINYFDLYTGDRLGGYSQPITNISYYCLSGRMTDGSYQSICGSTRRDNAIENIYCTLGIGQPYVEDGCYTPDTSDAAIQYSHLLDPSVDASGTVGSSPTTGPSRGNASRLSVPATGVLLVFFAVLLHSW
jgi:hypothetical protein